MYKDQVQVNKINSQIEYYLKNNVFLHPFCLAAFWMIAFLCIRNLVALILLYIIIISVEFTFPIKNQSLISCISNETFKISKLSCHAKQKAVDVVCFRFKTFAIHLTSSSLNKYTRQPVMTKRKEKCHFCLQKSLSPLLSSTRFVNNELVLARHFWIRIVFLLLSCLV